MDYQQDFFRKMCMNVNGIWDIQNFQTTITTITYSLEMNKFIFWIEKKYTYIIYDFVYIFSLQSKMQALIEKAKEDIYCFRM